MTSPSEQVTWLPVSAGDMSGGIWNTARFLFILQTQKIKKNSCDCFKNAFLDS